MGFTIVFISMAAHIPDDDWHAVKALCALVVQRRNFGLDFGAWRDLIPEVRRRWSIPEELLLANDSVLGPIYPLAPVIDTMRTGGEGLFGLTESQQGGVHLQSYMLLARGKPVVEDLMHFIQSLRISHSKWLLVQMGEIRLAGWMRRRGHRVAALFGYERLIRAALVDPNERKRLAGSYKRFHSLDRVPDHEAADLLQRWPLNPTHHLWWLLATRFNSPFVKTELVLRNPGKLPGVADWPNVVPTDSPVPLSLLQAHLQAVKAA
jgi:lipopolysaccharide biosynthesis protein